MAKIPGVKDPFNRMCGKLIRCRRDQLNYSRKALADSLRRGALDEEQLTHLEDGKLAYLSDEDRVRLEHELELPLGALGDHLRQHLRTAPDPFAIDPTQLLELLTTTPSSPTGEEVPACPMCATDLQRLIVSRAFRLRVRVGARGTSCLCDGKRDHSSALPLRFAVWLLKAKKVIILGGGQDVEDAARAIRFAHVRVIRERLATDATAIVQSSGLVVVAGGELPHSVSNQVIAALGKLPKNSRPLVYRAGSSNLTSITEAILDAALDTHPNCR